VVSRVKGGAGKAQLTLFSSRLRPAV
jgi:hypothetical protein